MIILSFIVFILRILVSPVALAALILEFLYRLVKDTKGDLRTLVQKVTHKTKQLPKTYKRNKQNKEDQKLLKERGIIRRK